MQGAHRRRVPMLCPAPLVDGSPAGIPARKGAGPPRIQREGRTRRRHGPAGHTFGQTLTAVMFKSAHNLKPRPVPVGTPAEATVPGRLNRPGRRRA